MDRITALTPRLAPGQLVARWALSSQQRARRNAMVAATELAARRLEHAEVAAYVAQALATRESGRVVAPARLAG